ncbi:dihydrofolate reductase family protein [Parasphingorhabdus pacifica]
MGEIHVNMYATLDGVIEENGGPTPEHETDFEYAGWQGPHFDKESEAQVIADVRASDALLLGRRTYDIFRRAWPGATDEIGHVFNRVPKYVASRGHPDLSWSGTTQITDVAAEVPALREEHKQMHLWGSVDLLQTLLREGLVDRLNLWVYPIVLGQGQKLFPDGTVPSRFELVEPATAFPAGAVLLRYSRVEGRPATRAMPEVLDQLAERGTDEAENLPSE